MDLPTRCKYLTFGDPESSRSLAGILDVKYLANIMRLTLTEYQSSRVASFY